MKIGERIAKEYEQGRVVTEREIIKMIMERNRENKKEELRKIAILIIKFITHYSDYKEIQDYTLKEVLERAFVVPQSIKYDEQIVMIVEKLIEEGGLEIKVKCVTKELSKAGLLIGGKGRCT